MEWQHVLGMCTKAAPLVGGGGEERTAHHCSLVLDILVALVQLDFIFYYFILYFCGNLYIP